MHILIIEDSKTISHIITTILKNYGYDIETITSNDLSLNFILTANPSVIILDLILEKGNSLSLLEHIRKAKPNIYIMAVSSRGSWKEKIVFLNKGGDDVITYPFPAEELLARIQTLLRRPKIKILPKIAIGKVKIDTDQKKAFQAGNDLELRRKEYNLLEYMAMNRNRTISRSELLDHVWDYRRISNSNTIDVHVKRLREKLFDKSMLQTVYGFGYRLNDKTNVEGDSNEDLSEVKISEI